MNDSVVLAEQTWPEYAEKVKVGAIVFLPLGATEQHGPHMAMNVDVVLPTAICERVARNLGGLVAPTLAYGCKSRVRSGGGEQFSGTTSLDAHTFSLTIRDVIRSLCYDGVRRIVVVCGHFENVWPSVEGVDLGLRELRRDGIIDVKVVRLDYWDFVRQSTLDRLFPDGFPGTELEHASHIETSLMLALRPDLVDMSKVPDDGPARFPAYDLFPGTVRGLPPSGVLARAERASAEQGHWLLDDHVTMMTAALRDEFGVSAA